MSKVYDNVDFSDLYDVDNVLRGLTASSELKDNPFIDKYSTIEQKQRD